MSYLSALGLEVSRRRALDFGCGVGRLTLALAEHFDHVVGIDIAPSMLEQARTHDPAGRCSFVLNESDNLQGLESGSFDLVYSNIVLQHIEPRFTRRYLSEFLRILKPQGVLVFQLPGERLPEIIHGVRRLLPRALRERLRPLRRLWQFPLMECHGIPRNSVEALLVSSGGIVVDVAPDDSAGPRWPGYRYCVKKGP